MLRFGLSASAVLFTFLVLPVPASPQATPAPAAGPLRTGQPSDNPAAVLTATYMETGPMSTQATSTDDGTATGARTPEHLMELFVKFVHERDLDRLIALYEPAAVFAPGPGAPVFTGREAIRGALAEMLALKPRMSVAVAQTLTVGDIALVTNEWTMEGIAPDGSPVKNGGKSADVVRRQPDGRWLVLIDHP